jgi:predicted amidohydrolase
MKSDNFELVKEKIQSFKKDNCDIIVLSELCVGGPGASNKKFYLDNYQDKFSAIAKELDTWLVPGTFYEQTKDQVFNVAPVFNPDGVIVQKCRKNFPWLPYEKGVASSDDICVFSIDKTTKVGVHICYDLWFPETSRALALNGAEIIINPTLTPTKDRDIEQVMVQATAAQQQLFYVDINGAGEQACGRSIVCNPDGEVMHESGDGEDRFCIELDLNHVRESRTNGIYGLGQPLKSFRDHKDFNKMYSKKDEKFLDSLGPLAETIKKNED